MFKNSPKVPTSTVVGCLAPLLLVPLALLVVANADGMLKVIAMGILGVFAIWFALMALDRDPLSAWENERLNESAPWLHRNEDIGRRAVAINHFQESAGRSSGKVDLNGEVWDAVCDDGSAIVSGTEVHVVARESLILVVSLSEESVPRGLP